MSLKGCRTYVGFGLGAIQAGLFLYEAFHSGNFRRLVVAEVVPRIVEDLRRAGAFYSVNIAHADRVESVRIGPVEVYNPGVAEDREQLVLALAQAEEIGTAIPSVELYASTGPESLHRTLAAGLVRKVATSGPRAVVYTAENNNAAAEILRRLVLAEMPDDLREAGRANVRFLNTVIGKMSGLVDDPLRNGLTTATPEGTHACLVEAFNRILISKIAFDPPSPFERGITVFEEKEDLLPFEEAKLFGHNATHALAAYLARLLGVKRMAELRSVGGFVPFLRGAFLGESGEALCRKHDGVDRLFTRTGYAEYADDLLERMTNPFLLDTVDRVGRDPARKLGWEDRLIGTMRLALSQDVEPVRYAIGTAAAFAAFDRRFLEDDLPADRCAAPLWDAARPEHQDRQRVLSLVEEGRRFLHKWQTAGFPNLDRFYNDAQ